ncbi:MAG TPA: adenine-specific methyltransferase EcoRI family protein [Ruminococcus flavefaciens]|nr:adenine-specific methyltransferase EcoRI family protein [Ruminococcus flavefaciens]
MPNDSKTLSAAGQAKKDEFYTQLVDIEKELRHYKSHFKDKIVFCNCDDPYESNFFKYFAINFNHLGLKKLICTCYAGSPVVYTQLSMFGEDEKYSEGKSEKKPYKIEITHVDDLNGDGAVDLTDVDLLLKSADGKPTLLKGDGDFRSGECIELLKEADIVVTNPPFSLFREFVAILEKYQKQYLIIGNVNALTYKEIFPLIKENRLWLGASIHSGDREFRVPDNYPLNATGYRVDENGIKYIRVKGVRWYTNLDYSQRHEDLILYKTYNPEEYPNFDNYKAIEIGKTSEIPCDYDGFMGVPITFMDKYSPDQFEIIGATESEGKGFSNGLWLEDSKVAQPLVGGEKKYKRIFVRRKK